MRECENTRMRECENARMLSERSLGMTERAQRGGTGGVRSIAARIASYHFRITQVTPYILYNLHASSISILIPALILLTHQPWH